MAAKMRHVITLCLLSSPALAAGPFDGIYDGQVENVASYQGHTNCRTMTLTNLPVTDSHFRLVIRGTDYAIPGTVAQDGTVFGMMPSPEGGFSIHAKIVGGTMTGTMTSWACGWNITAHRRK